MESGWCWRVDGEAGFGERCVRGSCREFLDLHVEIVIVKVNQIPNEGTNKKPSVNSEVLTVAICACMIYIYM